GASGWALRARCGRTGAWPRPNRLGDIARGAEAEWQHVVGNGDVRDGRDAEGAGRPARLRHGVRARIDHGNHDVPDRLMSALPQNISLRHIVPEILDGLAADDPRAIHSRRDLIHVNALMFNG